MSDTLSFQRLLICQAYIFGCNNRFFVERRTYRLNLLGCQRPSAAVRALLREVVRENPLVAYVQESAAAR